MSAAEQLAAAEELAQRRLEDNDRLKEELKSTRSRLASKQQHAQELDNELATVKAAKQLDLIEAERYRQENQLLRDQKQFLENESLNELDLVRQSKHEASKRASASEAMCDKLVSEKNQLESALARAQQDHLGLAKLTEELQLECRQLKLDRAQQDQARDMEASAADKLIEHLKLAEREAERDRAQLVARVSDVESALATAQQDLASAKQLVPELSSVSETANEAQLKQRGLTLSLLYSNYLAEVDKNKQLELSAREHKEQMQRILSEVERTVPELNQAKSRFLAASLACDEANAQLNLAFADARELRQQLHTCQQERKHLARDKRELELQAQDLASQVQSLLRQSSSSSSSSQAGMSTPGRSFHRRQEEDGDDAQDVISDSLVDFASVQELQQRNQELLRVIRRLNQADDEEEDHEEKKEDSSSVQRELDLALAELEKMAENRARQEHMVQEICKQRDLLRDMLVQQQNAASASAAAPVDEEGSTLATLKREAELAISALQRSRDELSQQLHDARFKLASLESEKQFETRRLEHAQHMLQQEQQETKRVQAALADTAQLLHSSQQQQERLQDDLQQAQRHERQLEQRAKEQDSLAKLVENELGFLKRTNASLQEQRDSFRKLQESLAQQLESFQQQAAEARQGKQHAEAELQAKLALAAQELQAVQQALTSAKQQEHASATQALESKQLVLQRDEEAVQLKRQLDDVKRELASLVEKRYADATSESLIVKLEDRDAQLAGFKQICEQHEATIALLEQKLAGVEHSRGEEERARAQAEAKLAGVQAALAAAQASAAQVELQRAELATELAQRQEQVALLTRQQSALAEDLALVREQFDSTQDNYSRLVQIHAKEMQTRRAHEGEAKQVVQLQQQVADAAVALQNKERELADFRQQAEAQLRDRQLVIADLERENRLCLDRLPTTTASTETAGTFDAAQLLQVCTNQRDRMALENQRLDVELSRTSMQLSQTKRELQLLREESALTTSAASSSSTSSSSSAQTDQEVQVLKGLNTLLVQSEQQLKHQVQAKQRELDAARAELESRVQDFSQSKARAQLAEDESKRREHEIKLLQQRLQDMLQRIGNAKAADELKAELELTKQQLAAAQEAHASDTAQLAEEQQRAAQAQQEADKSKTLIERFRKKIADDNKARAEVNDKLDKAQLAVKAKQQEFDELAAEMAKAKQDAAAAASAQHKKREEEEEEQVAALKKAMEEATQTMKAEEEAAAAAQKKADDAAAAAAAQKKKQEEAAQKKKRKAEDDAAASAALAAGPATSAEPPAKKAARVEEEPPASPERPAAAAAAATTTTTPPQPPVAALTPEMAALLEPVSSMKLGRRLLQTLQLRIAFKTLDELKAKLATSPLLSKPAGVEQVRQIVQSPEFLQPQQQQQQQAQQEPPASTFGMPAPAAAAPAPEPKPAAETKAQLAERIRKLEQQKKAAAAAKPAPASPAPPATTTTPTTTTTSVPEMTAAEEQAAKEKRANRFGLKRAKDADDSAAAAPPAKQLQQARPGEEEEEEGQAASPQHNEEYDREEGEAE